MKKSFPVISTILLFHILSSSCNPSREEPVQGVTAANGMVVSAHPLASQVGVDILKDGGNAIDAAIAVQFALAVVFPPAGNIGGGGFAIYREANGDVYALDYREKAPAKAHQDMYLDEEANVIDKLSTRGHQASGVPGSVAGMWQLHDRFGTMAWSDLVEPSVHLAADGFELTAREAGTLNANQEDFAQYNTVLPEFVMSDEWKEGDIIYYKDLARTLERIRDQGRSGFYEGETAGLIVAEMERGGGLISHEDLMTYESKWREPVVGTYRGHRIISMPPPSSGGIALLQLLKSIEPFNVSEMGFQTASSIHLMAEAERRVFADRSDHLGDSDFYDVPKENLLEEEYNHMRMESYNPDRATLSFEIEPGQFALLESEETTHYSIVDDDGNAISITTTINSFYGSKVFVAGAGFALNNEMDDFSSKPGFPNNDGLLGAEANAIEPGKRMLSSMTPTIVEKDGRLRMVVGSPGGPTIITSVFQQIVNVIDFDMGMQESVNAIRFHHQWKPDVIQSEEDVPFDSATMSGLYEKGHRFYNRGAIGRVDAILVGLDGIMEGAADQRRDDAAIGY